MRAETLLGCACYSCHVLNILLYPSPHLTDASRRCLFTLPPYQTPRSIRQFHDRLPLPIPCCLRQAQFSAGPASEPRPRWRPAHRNPTLAPRPAHPCYVPSAPAAPLQRPPLLLQAHCSITLTPEMPLNTNMKRHRACQGPAVHIGRLPRCHEPVNARTAAHIARVSSRQAGSVQL